MLFFPISLLSIFSKILEKVGCNRLCTFLETNNILSGAQFGFRLGHSTVHPMVHFVNQVSKALNNKEHYIAIFCDRRKAFDSCDHEILLRKLSSVGIRGNTQAWFKNYLSNRQQFVTVAGFNSSLKEIRLGGPQGSILGPILFGTPTKRQVSKRQVSKRPVSKRLKRQVYKTSGLQNVRFTKRQVYKMSGLQNVRLQKSIHLYSVLVVGRNPLVLLQPC